MTTFDLQAVIDGIYDIGRPVIFRSAYWDGSTPFAPTHLGNTEGEVPVEPNSAFSMLTLPENTGPAPIKAYHDGDAPTITFGAFMNPTQLATLSPTGSASAGASSQQPVAEHTLWIAPEQLFRKKDTDNIYKPVQLELSGGVWTKDGAPFTAEDTRLFNLGVFLWRGWFERATPVYRHADGGKSLRNIVFHVMQDFTKPEGHMLYTLGAALATAGIDLVGGS